MSENSRITHAKEQQESSRMHASNAASRQQHLEGAKSHQQQQRESTAPTGKESLQTQINGSKHNQLGKKVPLTMHPDQVEHCSAGDTTAPAAALYNNNGNIPQIQQAASISSSPESSPSPQSNDASSNINFPNTLQPSTHAADTQSNASSETARQMALTLFCGYHQQLQQQKPGHTLPPSAQNFLEQQALQQHLKNQFPNSSKKVGVTLNELSDNSDDDDDYEERTPGAEGDSGLITEDDEFSNDTNIRMQQSLEIDYQRQLKEAVSASLQEHAKHRETHIFNSSATTSDVTQTPVSQSDTQPAPKAEPVLTPLQKLVQKKQKLQQELKQSEKSISEEQEKMEASLKQQEVLRKQLNDMLQDMKLSERPMNFHDLYGAGIKIFDNNCTDLICSVVTILMRCKSLVSYFLSSQNEESNLISIDCKTAHGTDGITSDVFHQLVHQYWSDSNAKYAVDSQAITFLYKYYSRLYENYHKWDAFTFLWYIVDNLVVENSSLRSAFCLDWRCPKAIVCRNCTHRFALRKRKETLSLNLKDRNMYTPFDVLVLNQLTQQYTIFSFCRDDIIRGCEWQRYIMNHFNLDREQASLYFATVERWGDTPHNFQFLPNSDHMRHIINPHVYFSIFGWIVRDTETESPKSSPPSPLQRDESTVEKQPSEISSESPPQLPASIQESNEKTPSNDVNLENGNAAPHAAVPSVMESPAESGETHPSPFLKYPFIIVSIQHGVRDLMPPFLVNTTLYNGKHFFEKEELLLGIWNRLRPFSKTELDLNQHRQHAQQSNEDNNSLDPFFSLFFQLPLIFNIESTNEAKNDAYDSRQQVFFPEAQQNSNDPDKSNYHFVKSSMSGAPVLTLQVSNTFHDYFDTKRILEETFRKNINYHPTYGAARHHHSTMSDYLDEALHRYFRSTKCPECSHRNAVPNPLITHTPENIILHLKRYEDYKPKLDHKRVPYPQCNNIPVWIPYGFDLRNHSSVVDGKESLYQVTGIMSHNGDPLAGFWETCAYTHNSKGEWWHKFQPYTAQAVPFISSISPSIYVVAYEKVPPLKEGLVDALLFVHKWNLGGIHIHLPAHETMSQLKERLARRLNSPDLNSEHHACYLSCIHQVVPDHLTMNQLLKCQREREQNNNPERHNHPMRLYFTVTEVSTSPQQQAATAAQQSNGPSNGTAEQTASSPPQKAQ